MYKAVYVRTLFDGAVEIAVYGTCRNWNFAGDSAAQIESMNPGIIEAIAWVMQQHGIKRALVPKPAFNAVITTAEDLMDQRLPNFWRGVDADGVVLERSGDAYLLASADCLATCLYNPEAHYAMALHCGRDALIDRKSLSGGVVRSFPSVIDNAAFIAGDRIEQLQAFLAAGIGPDSFTHPTTATVPGSNGIEVENKYLAANQRLIEHLLEKWQNVLPSDRRKLVVTNEAQGKIDLIALVTAQLFSMGVPLPQIQWDGHDTATNRDGKRRFLFHSNRRDHDQRNLVVVKLN